MWDDNGLAKGWFHINFLRTKSKIFKIDFSMDFSSLRVNSILVENKWYMEIVKMLPRRRWDTVASFFYFNPHLEKKIHKDTMLLIDNFGPANGQTCEMKKVHWLIKKKITYVWTNTNTIIYPHTQVCPTIRLQQSVGMLFLKPLILHRGTYVDLMYVLFIQKWLLELVHMARFVW